MDEFLAREASEGSGDEDEDKVVDYGIGDKPNGDVAAGANEHTDSSEEEDDEDEEAIKEVREGFIVDSDVEEETRSHKRKRRKDPTEVLQETLDEDDLDLVLENSGIRVDRNQGKTLKRLKRGRLDISSSNQEGLQDIFSDDEVEPPSEPVRRPGMLDEFADFIENDYSDDEAAREALEVRRTEVRSQIRPEQLGMTEDAYEKVMEIFGNGEEYDWALEQEEFQQAPGERPPELKDVFEPSELADRMLTEEDQIIRTTDEPERFQILRKFYKDVQLSERDVQLESEWIYNRLLERRQATRQVLDPNLVEDYREAVRHVLHFYVHDNLEPPFVWQHRRDYLVQTELLGEGEEQHTVFRQLIAKDELWLIVEFDIRFRSIIQKRNVVRDTFLLIHGDSFDADELLSTNLQNAQMEDYQDLHDYLQFKYSEALRDAAEQLSTEQSNEHVQRRPKNSLGYWDKMRKTHIYNLVKDFGLSSSDFATNVANGMRQYFTQDPDQIPEFVADRYVDGEYTIWTSALKVAKELFAEEIFHEPQFRRSVRLTFLIDGTLNVYPSEKGVSRIDDMHQYADFKYLRSWSIRDVPKRPERYLRMLQAEQEGLVEVKVKLSSGQEWFTKLCEFLNSDNYSAVAEAWNLERKEVLEMVMRKIDPMMQRITKENLKKECESMIASSIRSAFYERLNKMPWKPHGFEPGETPKVLALSSGKGVYAGDATLAVFLNEYGDVLEHAKFEDMKEHDTKEQLVALIRKRTPDVLAIAGFSVDTRRLESYLHNVVDDYKLKATASSDDQTPQALKVVFVNDEVARLYQNSKRATTEFPDLPTLAKYCIGLARYMQSPLLEYAAIGREILNVPFHKDQHLLDEDRRWQALESALVDIVNKVGVEINEATRDTYKATLMQFVCGLGPRKWTSIQKAISTKGGWIHSRSELVTSQMMGKDIFMNCASFIRIPYKSSSKSNDSEPLDNTRLHPEDYELARKMAADALELDEEDLLDLEQSGGVVYELQKKNESYKLNELVLEEYADQLQKRFKQKKRVTLDIVKWELQTPFGELREEHGRLTDAQIFTMLTGETTETLYRNAVASVNVRKVGLHYVVARLDCGIEGTIDEQELSDDPIIKPSQVVHVGKTVEAVVIDINYTSFDIQLSIRERVLRDAKEAIKMAIRYRDLDGGEWAELDQEKDVNARAAKQRSQQTTVRVIKHPLFRPFNSSQAESSLGSMQSGDAIIRPSSLGPDHIAVTWKVTDGIFQHIDVLELGKENEFSLGKLLRVNNKYTYSDLDELLVSHVKSMSRKVQEMMNHDKYQKATPEDTAKWLAAYTEANPKRSSYAFCLDAKRPGYFHLCFKAGLYASVNMWSVKVIPNAFSLRGTEYGDMNALCNGFKLMYTSMQRGHA